MNYPQHENTPAQNFIGALLQNTELIKKYRTMPKGIFTEEADRHIFTHLVSLYDQYGTVDCDMLTKECGGVVHGPGDGDECYRYIYTMFFCCPNQKAYLKYADDLYAFATKHYVQKIAATATEKLTKEDAGKVMHEMEDKIQKLKSWKQNTPLPTLADDLQEFYEGLCREVDESGKKQPAFGYPKIDAIIPALYPGEVHIIGARPGVGKSMFALNVACHAAKRGLRVLYFSLEMNVQQTMKRLMGIVEGVSSARFQLKSDSFLGELATHFDKVNQLPIVFAYMSGISAEDVEATLIKQNEVAPVDLVIVDHMHLMQAPGTKVAYERMTHVVEGLKNVSVSQKVPIIALAQLNRAGATEEPTLTELRDSGSIEQTAETVFFITRDADKDADPTLMKLLLRKNRNGENYTNIFYRVDFDTYRITELTESSTTQKKRRS